MTHPSHDREATNRRLQRLIIPLSFLFVAGLVATIPGFQGDLNCWRVWTLQVQHEGLSGAYEANTDYPPVIHYLLWVFGALMGDADAVEHSHPQLRLFFYAADVLALYLVWRWAKRPLAFPLLVALSVLNIGWIYNSVIWGQADGLLALLACFALYLAWSEKFIAAAIVMTIALLFKIQAIVFLPLWGLLMLGGFVRKGAWLKLPLSLLAMAAVGAAVIAPFIGTATSRAQLRTAIFGSVDRYATLSVNAHNWWYLLYPDGTTAPDGVPWIGGFTYKQVGLLLFVVASGIALIPALAHTLRGLRNRKLPAFPADRVCLTAAVISLNFFFWPTQMHERYGHPALLFLLAYALFSRDLLPFIAFCIAYFLNLERVMKAFSFRNYDTLLFDPRTGAVLTALIMAYVYARLFGWRGFQRRRRVADDPSPPTAQALS